MNAIDLISVIAVVGVLVTMVVFGIRVMLYARSDQWKIDQRLSRYAGR